MPESTGESNKTITVGDQPATEDNLGFTPYVIAMAEFLTHPDTKPPLTISIEGEWGSGKSSFMKQLEAEILRKSEELEEQQFKEIWERLKKERIVFSNLADIGKFLKLLKLKIQFKIAEDETFKFEFKLKQKAQTICFNAWRHDKSESLWAAFALEFLEQISANRNFIDFLANSWSHFKLIFNRLEFKEKPLKAIQTLSITALIASLIVAIPIVYFQVGWDGVVQWSKQVEALLPEEKDKKQDANQKDELTTKKEDKNQKEEQVTKNEDENNLPLIFILILGGTGGSVAGIGKLFSIIRDLIGDPKMDLTQYLKSPDYEKEVAFIEKFHQDFKKIVDAYAGKDEKVYVFIDDLDRCELGKSADLLQALNLLISNDPNLVFILGMDREKVAAAITFKQKDILPFLASAKEENQAKGKEEGISMKQIDYGFSFMEKFVQLSFSVPKPSENNLNTFLETISLKKKEKSKRKSFFWSPVIFIVKYNGLKLVNFISQTVRELLPKQETEGRQNISIPNSESQKVASSDLAIFPIVDKELKPEDLKQLVEMVAPFLNYNPRRFKQYLNVLRLRNYMAYYAIGVPFDKINTITLEQLGKFVAIMLQYPRLLGELEQDDQQLGQLEKYAINPNNDTKDTVKDWVKNYPKLKVLLCYGHSDNETQWKRFSLQNEGIKKLLEIAPSGIDPKYYKLREFLSQGQWKEADQETGKVMCQAAGRESEGWLDVEDIDNFPCEDLRTIDQLWLHYSNGKFGFSVQKEIYESLGGTREYNEEVWKKFGDRIGWRKGGELLSNYSDLTFNLELAPRRTTPPLLFSVLLSRKDL
jgi:hypothetical protein